MSPLASAAAWSSSNQAPCPAGGYGDGLAKSALYAARSFTPRKATFMTVSVFALAVTAWTRHAGAAGNGNDPRIVFVPGSPSRNWYNESQPVLDTPRSPHAPPPVLW